MYLYQNLLLRSSRQQNSILKQSIHNIADPLILTETVYVHVAVICYGELFRSWVVFPNNEKVIHHRFVVELLKFELNLV